LSDIRRSIEKKVLSFIKKEEFKEALEHLRKFKRIFLPEDKEKYYFLMGYLALKSGDTEKAKLHFSRLKMLQPKKSLYHYFLGLANLDLAEYQESAKNFEEAHRLSPESKEYYKNLGWALVMNGKKKGLKILEDLFHREPLERDLLTKYIISLVRFGNKTQALWLSRIAYRNFKDPEFLELADSLSASPNGLERLLTKNEEKVLIYLSKYSGFDEETLDGLTTMFLGLKGKVYKRIRNPLAWAVALEVVANIFWGQGEPDFDKIFKKYRKYRVEKATVSRIIDKILVGGLVEDE